MKDNFRKIAASIADAMGSVWAFLFALVVILIWAACIALILIINYGGSRGDNWRPE
jgi:low affinity Fe/Cu permease